MQRSKKVNSQTRMSISGVDLARAVTADEVTSGMDSSTFVIDFASISHLRTIFSSASDPARSPSQVTRFHNLIYLIIIMQTFIFYGSFQTEVNEGGDTGQPVFLQQIGVIHFDNFDAQLIRLCIDLFQPLESLSAIVVLVD